MLKLSTRNRPGANHVTANALRAGLVLACCNAEATDEVAFGDGMALALQQQGDGQPEAAPEWVQLFPAGPDIKARDGRAWKLPDANALVLAFQQNGADLPFDINHATEILAKDGAAAPAQGWIKELKVREDGTTWARVDWTKQGAEAVAGKQYRYVSPGFRFTKATNQITAVSSAALVTHPALTMPALARQEDRKHQQQEQQHMKTLAERLREAMGLAADASDDAIVAATTTQVGLARDARDPSKLVPATDLAAAQKRATDAETALATIKSAEKEAVAVALIDGAIADGKIPPASKDHWLGLARENHDAAKGALDVMPKVLDVSKLEKKPGLETSDPNGLDAEQKALCVELGLDEKAFAATLKKDNA